MANVRHPRYMNARRVNEGEGKAMAVIPYFHSEMPQTLELYWRIMSTGDANPDKFNEYNLDVLAIPWFLVENLAALTGTTTAANVGSSVVNDAAWDSLYTHYAFSIGSDARYYGGEVGEALDQTDNEDEDTNPAESSSFDGNRSLLESYPPQQVISLFRSEPLMRIMTAEGEDKIRWGDEGRITIPCGAASGLGVEGGVVLVGMRKYDLPANDENSDSYGINMVSGTMAPVNAQLRSGMYKLVAERIRDGVSDVDDWLRTTLFDGDTNIEDDMADNGAAFNASVKCRISISTPYMQVM